MTVIKRIEFKPEIWQRIIELARREQREPRAQAVVMIEQVLQQERCHDENNHQFVGTEVPITP